MTLDRFDPNVRAVVAHCEQEIEHARGRLEAKGLDPVKTEHERGQIAALRALIGWCSPPSG